MFERFTDRARKVLVLAQECAHEHKHSFIGTEHLLYGLAAEGAGSERGVAASVLSELKITPEDIANKMGEIIGGGAVEFTGNPPFTPRSKKVLELGLREALQLGHSYIGTEHLLLGLVREGEGAGATILAQLGANFGELRNRVLEAMGAAPAKEESDFKMPEDWIRTVHGEVYIPAGDAYVKATFAIKPDGTLYKFKQIPVQTWVATDG